MFSLFSLRSCSSSAPMDFLYPSPGAELASGCPFLPSEASLALSDSRVASFQSPDASWSDLDRELSLLSCGTSCVFAAVKPEAL